MAKFSRRLFCAFTLVLMSSSVFALDNTCGWIWWAAGSSRPVYMKHDGEWRSYRIYVSSQYRPGAPLIVDMHGQTSTRNSQIGLSCWKDLAEREGAIVVYPQALGIPTTWDAGDYCCYPRGHDDDGFILHMVQCLSSPQTSGLVLDHKRVYAAGFSNGAALAGKLACDHSDVFAGAALASQGFPYHSAASCRSRDDNKNSPFPVLEVRGKWDYVVPYFFSLGWSPSASQSIQRWASANHCVGEPEITDTCDEYASAAGCIRNQGHCIRYDNCEGGVEVKQCSVNDDHFVFHNPQQLNFCDAAWQQFQTQPIRP